MSYLKLSKCPGARPHPKMCNKNILCISTKRGSNMSRQGGTHSGPHTKRQTRFLRVMNQELSKKIKSMRSRGQ